MNDEIREALEALVLEDLKAISQDKQIGSEERGNAVKDVEKLYKLYLDDYKMSCEDADSRDRMEAEKQQREFDNEYKRVQAWWDNIDRRVKWGLEAAGITLPVIFSWFWMKRGFKFETDGTFTSDTFRWLRQKFFRIK